MAILILQHSESCSPGRLGACLRDHGFRLDIRRVDLPVDHPINRTNEFIRATGKLVPSDLDNIHGLISMGGPQNVGESHPFMDAELNLIRLAHQRQLPIVGVCLGHQLIAAALGGTVAKMAKPEIGFHRVSLNPAGQTEPVLAGIAWDSPQYQTHSYEVTQLPPGATLLASSKSCKVQSFKAGLRTYGFQYHPEFDRAMIEASLKTDAEPLAQAGLSANDVLKQCEEEYQTFARLADRLCVNIAAYMLPMTQKLAI